MDPNRHTLAQHQQLEYRYQVEAIKQILENLYWGASSRWSSSLYCLMRNSDEITIGKSHPPLYRIVSVSKNCFFQENPFPLVVWRFYQELLGLQILQTLHRVHHWKDLYPCKYTFHRTSLDNPCEHSSRQLSRTCERLEGLLGRLLQGIFLQKQPFNRFESDFRSF